MRTLIQCCLRKVRVIVRNVHSAITVSGQTAEEREAEYLYWQYKREKSCNEDELVELASKE